ncbi:anthranilate synthase component I family protein [Lactobacillus sp. S2-2]|uniref:anthranilate synthase component I family protein n=1 Tax=Lactobacillus sp. S2-2 TaxID=2692917 RepID=UPI001F24A953|nr:anthranilate synthase component I family protein [Lactobacillus sp. S2-2]MCF6515001.1 anthranilate synthase component I family protein [Lactobacillus sp. S2-2]
MIPKELLEDRYKYNYLPINYEIKDIKIDINDLVKFYKEKEESCFVLNQEENNNATIVINPKMIFKGNVNQIKIYESNKLKQIIKQNPIEYFENLLNKYKTPRYKNYFTSGLIGYFSYEFIQYIENVNFEKIDNEDELDDFELFLPEVTINYDYQNNKLMLSYLLESNQLVDKYEDIICYLKKYVSNLLKIKKVKSVGLELKNPYQNQFTYSQFEERVNQAKDNIKKGNIFQLILSNPYYTNVRGNLIEVFNYLNKKVDSPYKFYFSNDDFETTGASPETLVKKIKSNLYSYPLAGTRRRGNNLIEDKDFANELLNNKKEISEHNMLVDLGRNDLGKISQMGTVEVIKLRKLIKYSNVMHLGSKIRGKSISNISPIKIIGNVLPAGTLSGAPKVSAINIISELENNKRGIYGGGIGYIDFDEDLDLCIGIRLAYKKKNKLVIRSGAGIVSDSEVNKEYKEFKNKSKLMIDAVEFATKSGGNN